MSEQQIALAGVDVGGTFTDFVVLVDGKLAVYKISTTPVDQSRAIVSGLRALGMNRAEIVHGMTVATNALLERRGARTALLTTEGFGDVLLIGRQNRPQLYRLSQQRPPSLVPEELRLEAPERIDHTGKVLRPLDEKALGVLLQSLRDQQAESLAIVFLFSFRNAAHEQRAAEIIRQTLPDLPLSLSSEILPEYREFERTATTVINAYVQPLVARYLERLERALLGEGFDDRPRTTDDSPTSNVGRPWSVVRGPSSKIRIMQSNGGAIGLHQAAAQAARLVLSGPAGGVVGAFELARQAISTQSPVNFPPISQSPEIQRFGGDLKGINILTFDMGGTSTDVALCPGAIPTTAESTIGDLPLRLPVIDIHTVGAGGGSIAYVDVGGGLRVGPRSAGAEPGPACYGRGGVETTVTDANLVLGRLDPAGFLGGAGDVSLDVAAARNVLAQLGRQLGLGQEQAALGVIRVVNATMERALRRVSVERGHDPRQFTLVPFGGAGPLHACDLAGALGIRRILVPPFPGVLSAYGMLVADIVYDASQSILRNADDLFLDDSALRQAYHDLSARVSTVLHNEAVANPLLSAALDMRYRGQSYELSAALGLPLDSATLRRAVDDFHTIHEQRYGYAMRHEIVQVVTLRVRGQGPGARPELPTEEGHGPDASAARLPNRPVWFNAEGPTPAAGYDRDKLRAGNRFTGPAVVFQFDATTVVAPGWEAWVDAHRNIWLEKSV
jgi:N-methylhydantoinase A